MGIQKALSEEDIDTLIKEAQEMGIDLEKLGWGALLGGIGQGLSTGAKALGGGLKAMGGGLRQAGQGAMQGWKGSRGLGLGQKAQGALFGAKGSVGQAWKGLNPLQKKMMMGAGGAGLYAM
jgi:hypothetical protein